MTRSLVVLAGVMIVAGSVAPGPSSGAGPDGVVVTGIAVAAPAAAAVDDDAAATHQGLPGIASVIVRIARSEPAAFFALFVAGVVLFAPGSAFTLAAGLAYGVWLGVLLSIAATTVAASIHFILARRFLCEPVRGRLLGRRRFEALDCAMTRDAWKIVGLTRVSALIPGAVQNLFYALTAVRFRTFVLASVAGLLPPTLLWVTAGSTGGKLLAGSAGGAGPTGIWIQLVGLAVLALTLACVVRAARRELARAEERAGRRTG